MTYTVAVGDIHGCYDELMQLIDHVHSYTFGAEDTKWIFLGDYVDRGPDTKKVIDFLIEFQKLKPVGQVTCLMGNHEDNFLQCLKLKDRGGFENYLLNNSIGGQETMKSYGGFDFNFIPDKHISWMNDLFLWHLTKHEGWPYPRIFVHAGIDREHSMSEQEKFILLWDREFRSDARIDGGYVVHGHTPKKRPEIKHNRINIDTGCVFGGDYSLTAAIFNEEKLEPKILVNHRGTWTNVP